MIDGGATEGYCATGSCVTATPPKTRMKSAMTHAKMGRSMKNWAMAALAAGGRLGSGCSGRRGGGRRTGGRWFSCTDRLPGHRLHRHVWPQLLETVDHDLLTGIEAF